MFLHIGADTIIRTKDIIGIFDMDNTTISKHTRSYLRGAETNKQVINVTDDLPRTFVITNDRKVDRVYATNISAATLQKRGME